MRLRLLRRRIVVRLGAALILAGSVLSGVRSPAAYGDSVARATAVIAPGEEPYYQAGAVSAVPAVNADDLLVDPYGPNVYDPQAPEGPIVLQPTPYTYPSSYPDAWWSWQFAPDGLIYRSYLAGTKEPRLSAIFFRDLGDDIWQLDATVGGRVGLLRYGAVDRPEGWQLDAEGAAFPRINIDQEWDVDATDFRYGFPLTYGDGPYRVKFGFYHLSSHLGDERAKRIPDAIAERINFTRDVLVLGGSYYFCPEVRLYAEVGYAFHDDDGSEPWEFQFGLEAVSEHADHLHGAPFFAINLHLHEEDDFGGQFTTQAGWLWQGVSGHTFRTGLHLQTGKTNQFEFFTASETLLGWGFWYDY